MKLSIVIPVYNVEPYLRQCLDSVVGQTLQDIQILCVDHSSTDGSLAILEEFAAKDSRIEIIHCENTGGGPGQARNAALPHVKGKYICFCDSDDWLDPTLCEKAYYRLEQSGSDIMFLYPHEIPEPGQEDRKYFGNTDKWLIQSDALYYLDFPVPPWNRVFRVSYLENIALRFPEGKLPEDKFFHWASLVHEPKVIFLPQRLCYHRLRAGSEMGERGEYASNQSTACDMIKRYLQSIGKYEKYRVRLLNHKFSVAFWAHNYVLPEFKDKVKQRILDSIDDDEIAFIRERGIAWKEASNFCLDILSFAPLPIQKSEPPTFAQKFKKINRKVMLPIEDFVRALRGKPKKTVPSCVPQVKHAPSVKQEEPNSDRQIRELSELVCLLSKEIVEMREELQNQSNSNTLQKRAA